MYIVQAVVCRPLLLPTLLSRPNPSPDAVRSRNPSKSTLAHDAVVAAVSHKHHSIIHVGAGLIQFVHGSHSCWATEFTHHRKVFSPFFARVLQSSWKFPTFFDYDPNKSTLTNSNDPNKSQSVAHIFLNYGYGNEITN